MNIFYLIHDVHECAQHMVDRHVVKMILEYAQLLCTAHRVLSNKDLSEMYKVTHKNHPSAKWVRESDENYKWLYSMFVALLEEYTYRYGKIHACSRLVEPLKKNPCPPGAFTEPTPAMPEECKVDGDSIASYRRYYNNYKTHLFTWTKRSKPEWCVSDNYEIVKRYKVKFCGGIRKSNFKHTFVLIINSSVERYQDGQVGTKIDYEGEYIGLSKTQTMTRNNKSLNEHQGSCHVYKKIPGTKYYEHLGEYMKYDEPRFEPNKYGGQRIIFPLMRI